MTKPTPKIEMGTLVHNGVIHAIPYTTDDEGKKKYMKGHSVNADCCYTTIIKTSTGHIMVTHSVIH